MGIRFGLFSDLHYSLPGTDVCGNSWRTFEDTKKGLARFAKQGYRLRLHWETTLNRLPTE